MVYCGRAVHVRIREDEPHEHLYIVLSEPSATRDALVICVDTYRFKSIESPMIPAGTILTGPKSDQYRVSRDSQIDIAFTDLMNEKKLARLFAIGRDRGLATPAFFEFCKKAVVEWVDDAPNYAVSCEIQELEREWFG